MRYSMLKIIISKNAGVKQGEIISLPSLRSQPSLLILKVLLARFPRHRAFLRQDRLNANVESRDDGPMVGGTNFMPPILELLNAAQATVENAVAPGRGAFFLARIVLVSADIVFVRRCESDRRLGEAAESEAWVFSARCQKLIAFEKFGEVVLADSIDDNIAWDGINAVIQIPIQDTDLMIHDHRTVAATSELIGASCEAVLGW